jgi:hypothetical protein
MALATGLNTFASYATVNWQASFFIRNHGMSTGELGTWLAFSPGLLGGTGLLAEVSWPTNSLHETSAGTYGSRE